MKAIPDGYIDEYERHRYSEYTSNNKKICVFEAILKNTNYDIAPNIMKELLQSLDNSSLMEAGKIIPEGKKTQELFDVFKERLDLYAAVVSYGPNFITSEQIEEILQVFNEHDKDLYINTFLQVNKDMQTSKMHDMFMNEIKKMIEEAPEQEKKYDEFYDEYVGFEESDFYDDYEYEETEKGKEYYLGKLRMYISKISPELLTPQNFEKFYKLLPNVWKYVPEKLQNDDLFDIAVSKEENIYSIWNYTKDQSIGRMKKIITKLLEGRASEERYFEALDKTDPLYFAKIFHMKNLQLNETNKILLQVWEIIKEKNFELLEPLLSYTTEFGNLFCEELLETIDKNDIQSVQKLIFVSCDDKEKAEKRFNRYKELALYNQDINQTIKLEFLDEEFNFLGLEERVRISAYESIQKLFIEHKNNKGYLFVLDRIMQDTENNIASLGKFYRRYEGEESWQGILRNNELFDKELTKQENKELVDSLLYLVLNNEENYFEIDNIEKLRNFKQIRQQTCIEILNGNNTNYPAINNMPELEKKKFAILELLYGIDYKEATKLSTIYGKDIAEIRTEENSENANVQEFIKAINSIINLNENEMDELLKMSDFMEIIHNSRSLDIGITTDIEDRCIRMYSELYKESVFSLDSDLAKQLEHKTINYNGTDIETIELSPKFDEDGNIVNYVDFMMIGRVDGAYDEDYVPPENYNNIIDIPRVRNHGNCESVIAQDLLALARPSGGATFGYSSTDGMLMQAPWDIRSSTSNDKFDTVNNVDNEDNGKLFLTPRRFIDYTRHTHNELVFERVSYDEDNNKLVKRKPSFVIYLQEVKGEWESGKKAQEWWEVQKAATQLHIPIVIINREKFAIQEEQKINDYLEIFEGRKENKMNLSQEELLYKMLVGFENNSIGIHFSRLAENYFTDEKRDSMLSRVMGHIIDHQSKSEQIENLQIIKNIIEQEKAKTLTTKGITTGYTVPAIYEKVEKMIDNFLSRSEAKIAKEHEKVDFINSSISQVSTSNIEKVLETLKNNYRAQQENIQENKKENNK